MSRESAIDEVTSFLSDIWSLGLVNKLNKKIKIYPFPIGNIRNYFRKKGLGWSLLNKNNYKLGQKKVSFRGKVT